MNALYSVPADNGCMQLLNLHVHDVPQSLSVSSRGLLPDLPTLVNCQAGHTLPFPCHCLSLLPASSFPSPLPFSLSLSLAILIHRLPHPTNPAYRGPAWGSAVSSPAGSGSRARPPNAFWCNGRQSGLRALQYG